MPRDNDVAEFNKNISQAIIHLNNAFVLAFKMREENNAHELKNIITLLTIMEQS